MVIINRLIASTVIIIIVFAFSHSYAGDIIIDTDGKSVEKGTICLASRVLDDGRILIYRENPADVERLIADMVAAGEKDPQLLSKDYWLHEEKKACHLMAASKCKKGTCSGEKKCKSVISTGGFNYCKCK